MNKEKLISTVHVQRAIHKLTQEVLAKNVGCVRQTIHAIEVGKIVPNVSLVLRIVRYLNTLKSESQQIKVEDIFKLE